MNQRTRRVLFCMFFVSGFCSLVYQIVWTRLAFASFGIITPVLSVVLSVFMLGLALGSWAGGRWIPAWTRRAGRSAAVFYAGAELLIGLGAFAVPQLFAAGERVLLASGDTNSLGYLSLSALVLAVAILPWCVCMGATFPLMMAYVREQDGRNTQSFSFLYLANVLGAMSGTLLTAVVFVEIFGFHQTLKIAAMGNFIIALTGIWLGLSPPKNPSAPLPIPASETSPSTTPANLLPPGQARRRFIAWVLFSTGFCAMAMEVVWTRAFTPVLKTQVYSFALIVFTYLGATFLGSLWYRHHLKKSSPWPASVLLALLVVAVFLPVIANDPRLVTMDWYSAIHAIDAIIVLASIVPFCAILGYLTPGLIDEYAAGDPTIAGRAYAINVLGCILGPLIASYVLLPWMSERYALTLLALPLFGLGLPGWKTLTERRQTITGLLAGALAAYALLFAHDFLDRVALSSRSGQVRRDYAASVISADPNGSKVLLVNGMGMTKLTPITKFMVHLPMAYHKGLPQSALIICFGMGTSYRSALSWSVPTTVVELIPDVPKAMGYYHADAAQVLANPLGRIVIDDGRRFLMRTHEKYDVIVIDPPPPVEAAGCSLLYSREFYELVKQHLNPDGVLQAWYPGQDRVTLRGFSRAIANSFPYSRCFPSVEGWGFHVLASMSPIENETSGQLAARMPAAAKKDLIEWGSSNTVPAYLNLIVSRAFPIDDFLTADAEFQITDDDPLNEYFLLRRMGLF